MGEANERGTFEQRRAAALVAEREVRELRRRMGYLAAIVRREGRVRITKQELEAIGVAYTMKLHREGDTITLTWQDPAEGA